MTTPVNIFPGKDEEFSTKTSRRSPMSGKSSFLSDNIRCNHEEHKILRYNQIFNAINSIGELFNSMQNFDYAMNTTISEVAKTIECDTAAVVLKKDRYWNISYVYGYHDYLIGMEINEKDQPHSFLAIKTKKPIVINDAFNDERVNRDYMKKCNIRSTLVVPLISRNEVIGVLFFNYQTSIHVLDDIEIYFVTQFASLVSLALRNFNIVENLSNEIFEHKMIELELKEAYENLQTYSEELQAQSEELQVFNEDLQAQSEEIHIANEALFKSEQQLKAIIDSSPGIIFVKDLTGRFILINKQLEEIVGMTCEEIKGKNDYDTFSPEWAEYHRMHDFRVLETGVPEQIEEIAELNDGLHFFLANKFLLNDSQGKPYAICSISTDITERKKAEEALKKANETLEEQVKERTSEIEKAYNSMKESEERLAEAQKIAHIGNFENNLVTSKLYWSDELYHIFGLKPQEGMTYDRFLSFVHPDNRDSVYDSTQEAFKGNVYTINYRIVRSDGEERIIHSEREVVFDGKKNPVKIKGTLQDVTERNKAEEKIKILANVVESSNDAIITASLDCIVTSWNKGAEQIYGYSADEIIGQSASVLEPDYLKGEVKQFNEKIKRGEKVKNHETVRLKKDGTQINVSVSLSPVFDDFGRISAISIIVRDITERIKAEKLMARAEEAKKKEIHHRIKNNLQVISSLLDLQADKFNDPKVIESFKESQNRIKSMALIHEELYKNDGNDILNFSEYLNMLSKSLSQTYRPSYKNICIFADLVENTFFDMDTAILLGIIVNELVSNSFKHAFPGKNEGEIYIKLQNEEKEDYQCNGCKRDFILTVLDNGVGIPEDIKIEDLDSLGLQLITTLVDQLDGELELKRDNGTEFIIRFTVPEKRINSCFF